MVEVGGNEEEVTEAGSRGGGGRCRNPDVYYDKSDSLSFLSSSLSSFFIPLTFLPISFSLSLF